MMPLVNLIGVQSRALDGFADYDGAQLRRAQIAKSSLKFSYCRTTTGNDDNIIEAAIDHAPAKFSHHHYRCSRQRKRMNFHGMVTWTPPIPARRKFTGVRSRSCVVFVRDYKLATCFDVREGEILRRALFSL